MTRSNRYIWTFLALGLVACGEPVDKNNQQRAYRQTGADASAKKTTQPNPIHSPGTTASDTETPAAKPPKPVTSRNPVVRFATPGMVRFTVGFQKPVTFFRWSPLAGLVVSAGNQVHNVTSKGKNRWHVVAGKEHQLFVVGGQEVLWSPAFNRLTQLLRHGRLGWKRPWAAELTADSPSNSLFLIDAATIAALGEDGKDRWRNSMEGLRSVEGPFSCDDGVLFHSIRGLEGVAVSISKRGSIVHETNLQRGAVVLGSSQKCEPIVWQDNEVALLASTGVKSWGHRFENQPIFKRLPGGYLFLNSGAQDQVSLRFVNKMGTQIWNKKLPVTGRVTDLGVVMGDTTIQALGLCMDVSSPCAKPKGNRGPYNAILSMGKKSFTLMTRHISGHLGFANYPGGGFVEANSPTETQTEVTRRDGDGNIIWTTSLSGRISEGPYVGPDGEIYVATCNGWSCYPPYTLTAVTGREPLDEPERRP